MRYALSAMIVLAGLAISSAPASAAQEPAAQQREPTPAPDQAASEPAAQAPAKRNSAPASPGTKDPARSAERGQGSNRGYVVGKGGVTRLASSPSSDSGEPAARPPKQSQGATFGERVNAPRSAQGVSQSPIGVNEPGVNLIRSPR